VARTGFFQHFCKNSTAKKSQFLPFWQKLKAIFVQKLKVGGFYLRKICEKKSKNGQKIQIFPKNST